MPFLREAASSNQLFQRIAATDAAPAEQQRWISEMNRMAIAVLALVFACSTAFSQDESSLYGRWVGYSKAIYSIYGDLLFEPGVMTLEKKGRVSYKVIARVGSSMVVEIDRDIDCGRYIRVGPILPAGDMFEGYMEFGMYSSRESALAGAQLRATSRSPKGEDYCSWGLYSR